MQVKQINDSGPDNPGILSSSNENKIQSNSNFPQSKQKQTIKKFIGIVRLVIYMIKNNIPIVDLYAICRKSLEVQPKLRTEQDLLNIDRYMSRISFFQRLKQRYGYEVYLQVCNNLYYAEAKANKTIIQIHQEGRTFFVILHGSVSVNIYLPIKDEYGNIMEESKQFEVKKINVILQVNVLKSGDTFGELALLNDSKTTATIVAKENCEFSCLNKNAYQKILGSLKLAEIKEKVDLIKEYQFLKGWQETDLKTLSFQFEVQKFKNDEFIYHEGDQQLNYVYFVKYGEFEMSKSITVIPQSEFDIVEDIQEFQNPIFMKKKILICKLTIGEVFGDEEYLNLVLLIKIINQPKKCRQFSVKSNMFGTEVFRIKKQDLERRLWDKDSGQILLKIIQEKNDWRLKRFEQVQKILGSEFQNQLLLRKQAQPQLVDYLNPQMQQMKEKKKQNLSKKNGTRKISCKPSQMIFNFLEAEKTLYCLKEAKEQNEQRLRRVSSKILLNILSSTDQFPLQDSNTLNQKMNFLKNYNKKKKSLTAHNQFSTMKLKSKSQQRKQSSGSFLNQQLNDPRDQGSPIDLISSKYRYMDEQDLDEETPEKRLGEFLNQMDFLYQDENIDWGGGIKLKDVLENRRKFYFHLKEYSDLNKVDQISNNLFFQQSIQIGRSMKPLRVFIQIYNIIEKALMIEYEFQQAQKNSINLNQVQNQIKKSEKQIRVEYFLRQLKKMQFRLKILNFIRQGLIVLKYNQYVDEDGQIVLMQNTTQDEKLQQVGDNFFNPKKLTPSSKAKSRGQHSEKNLIAAQLLEELNETPEKKIDILMNELKIRIEKLKKQKYESEVQKFSNSELSRFSFSIANKYKQTNRMLTLNQISTASKMQGSPTSLIQFNDGFFTTQFKQESNKVKEPYSCKYSRSKQFFRTMTSFDKQKSNSDFFLVQDDNGIQFKRTFAFS